MSQITTSKRWRTWRPRRVRFVAAAGTTLADLLGSVGDAEQVFLCGPRVGGTPDGFAEWSSLLPGGWSHDPAGHYLESLDHHVLRYRADSGQKVEIGRAAVWFGEGEYSPTQADAAYTELALAISGFAGGTLLATPATTGRDLFVRSLGTREYPVADAQSQALIRATSGQGRIELIHHKGDLPGLAEYDGRLMYGALCWGLGSGVGSRAVDAGWGLTTAFRAEPYLRARYLVEFEIPDGWNHVGLLGVGNTDGGWLYPRRPGARCRTWCDGSELMLLMRYGWPFRVAERLTLESQPQGPGPLGEWARKLTVARERLLQVGERLAANGVRAILLHSIGAFHGAPHKVTRMAPIDQPRLVPIDAVGLRVEGDSLVWGESRAPAWAALCHPEWSSAIWARCRARMLHGPISTGAMNVPFGDVVAFRTDALYITRQQVWGDDGKAGRLTLRSWLPGPIPAPTSVAELLALRDRGRNGS